MSLSLARCSSQKHSKQIRGAYDFVDVRDVAKGLVLALEKGRKGEAYILPGTQVKITQIKKMVQDVAGVQSPELVVPYGWPGTWQAWRNSFTV